MSKECDGEIGYVAVPLEQITTPEGTFGIDFLAPSCKNHAQENGAAISGALADLEAESGRPSFGFGGMKRRAGSWEPSGSAWGQNRNPQEN